MKKIISKMLSGTKYTKFRYLNFLTNYDKKRFIDYSGLNKKNDEHLAAHIRILSHTLEKGLSLKSVRVGFGKQKVEKLIDLYEKYSSLSEKKDPHALLTAESVIAKYIEFQKDSVDLSFIPKKFFETEQKLPAGAFRFSKEDFLKNGSFEAIAHARHSIRDYDQKPLDKETVAQAIALAQTAPSACNRQSTKVYVCQSKDKIEAIVKKHGGFSGFESIGAIFALTGDLNLYTNELERSTLYVDGGIFTMNLLYSLQHYGIGTCPIIWGSEPDNDSFLHSLLGISENETVVCLVAAGYFPENGTKAAVSHKRNAKDILKFI